MHQRYGRIAIAVAIVGVAAGGTTAVVAWTNSGGSPSATAAAATDSAPASVLGFTTTQPSAAPTSVGTAPSESAASAVPSPTAAPTTQPPITYVVKKGDNLSVIAAWFKLHGYGALYQANRAVIGDNPNLIFVGQQITISGGLMTVGSG